MIFLKRCHCKVACSVIYLYFQGLEQSTKYEGSPIAHIKKLQVEAPERKNNDASQL